MFIVSEQKIKVSKFCNFINKESSTYFSLPFSPILWDKFVEKLLSPFFNNKKEICIKILQNLFPNNYYLQKFKRHWSRWQVLWGAWQTDLNWPQIQTNSDLSCFMSGRANPDFIFWSNLFGFIDCLVWISALNFMWLIWLAFWTKCYDLNSEYTSLFRADCKPQTIHFLYIWVY